MSYEFPEFENLQDGFLHAIGRIATKWNDLETTLSAMISFSSLTKDEIKLLNSKLNNSMKLLFIKASYQKHEKERPSQGDNLAIFLKFYQICCANRNFYVHASFHFNNGEARFSKKSDSKIGVTNTIRPSLDEVQKVSQEMKDVSQFGSEVLMRLRFTDDNGITQHETTGQKLRVAQPSRPSQPKTWDTHPTFETHPKPPRQPQSSPQ